jgi:hypothetical protein
MAFVDKYREKLIKYISSGNIHKLKETVKDIKTRMREEIEYDEFEVYSELKQTLNVYNYIESMILGYRFNKNIIYNCVIHLDIDSKIYIRLFQKVIYEYEDIHILNTLCKIITYGTNYQKILNDAFASSCDVKWLNGILLILSYNGYDEYMMSKLIDIEKPIKDKVYYIIEMIINNIRLIPLMRVLYKQSNNLLFNLILEVLKYDIPPKYFKIMKKLYFNKIFLKNNELIFQLIQNMYVD